MKLSLKKLGSRSASRRIETVSVEPLVKELTATFQVFNKDGDGRISRSELGLVMRSLGDDMSEDELDEVIVNVDGDGDGFIDLQEFITFHTENACSRDSSASSKCRDGALTGENFALQAAFQVFDVDNNGFISAEELQRVMRTLGDKNTSLAERRHMINCVDKGGDKMVDFHEFQCLMSRTFVC